MTAASLITAITGFLMLPQTWPKLLGGEVPKSGGVSPLKGAWIKPWPEFNSLLKYK